MALLNLDSVPAAAYPNKLERNPAKKGHAYIKQMAQAYVSEVHRSQTNGKMWYYASADYATLLQYALGKQDTKQYERYRAHSAPNQRGISGVDAWRQGQGGSDARDLSDAVDQSPLPVLPIKLRALEALLDERGYDPTVTVLGPTAEHEMTQLVAQVRQWMERGQALSELGMPKPAGLPADIPQDEDEMQMFLEDLQLDAAVAMEEKQAICIEESDLPQLSHELRQDLLRYGLGCLTDYQQPGKRPLLKRIRPNRGLFLPSAYPDCRDWWAGAYIEAISISDLRAEVAAGRALDNNLPDIDWKQIEGIGKASLPVYMQDLDPELGDALASGSVQVIRVYFLSDDDEVQQTKTTSRGNKKTYRKEPGFKNESGKGTVTRRTLSNVYEATLIVGTDIAYNCRLAVEQRRDLHNPLKGRLPFSAYIAGQLDGHAVSTVDYCKSIINDMERSIRMWRTDMKTYVPEGANLDFTNLESWPMKGKNGQALTPPEAFEFYLQTGYTFGPRTNDNQEPIGEVSRPNFGGVPQSAQQHWTDFWNSMQLLEMVTGANAVASAATPSAELGKAVANMAITGAQNVLKYLFRAQESVHASVFRNLAARIKYTEHRNPVTGMRPLPGGGAKQVNAFPGLHKYEFVTGIEIRPTPEEWQDLYGMAKEAAAAARAGSPDGLDPEDYFAITRATNLKKAQRDLARRIKRRRKRIMQESAQQQEQNGQVQTQSIQAKLQADEQLAQANHARLLEVKAFERETMWGSVDRQVNAAFAQKDLETQFGLQKTAVQEQAETERTTIKAGAAQEQQYAQHEHEAQQMVGEAMLTPPDPPKQKAA